MHAIEFAGEVEQNPDFFMQRGNELCFGQNHSGLLFARQS
jgi:hypothetical protein